jgi:hypothetical protein
MHAVLGFLGDSDLLINFVAGTVLGQFISLELMVCYPNHGHTWPLFTL